MAAISAIDCQICLQSMVGRSPRALPCLHTFCESCLVSLQSEQASQNPPVPQYAAGFIRHPYELMQEEVQDNNPYPYHASPYNHNIRHPYGRMGQDINPFQSPPHYHPYNPFPYHASPRPILSGSGFVPKAKITCPICRNQAELPPNGVKALPINFMISQMKDLHVENEKSRKCQLCRKDQAMYACETCVKHLCKKCKDQHEGVPAFLNHNVRRLEVAKQCKKHQSDAVYVCTTCALQICVECVMCDNHQAHKDNIMDYETWITSEREKLKQLQSHLKPKLGPIQADLRKLKKYRENIEGTLSVVDKSANEAKKKIDTDQKILRNKLQQQRQETMNSIRELEACFWDARKICLLKEDNMNKKEIISGFVNATSRGEIVKERMTRLSPATITWFTFTPEENRMLGTLETLETSDMKAATCGREANKCTHRDAEEGGAYNQKLDRRATTEQAPAIQCLPGKPARGNHKIMLAWSEETPGLEHQEGTYSRNEIEEIIENLRTQLESKDSKIQSLEQDLATLKAANVKMLQAPDITGDDYTCPKCGEAYPGLHHDH